MLSIDCYLSETESRDSSNAQLRYFGSKAVRVQDMPGASNSSTEAAISAFDNFHGGTAPYKNNYHG